MLKALFIFIILISFLMSSIVGPMLQAYADDFRLPTPGTMLHISLPFNPPILIGIKVHPDNPFRFDFILDKGLSSPNASGRIDRHSQLFVGDLKQQAAKLIKYFLASLTVPEKDLWVNLSPYEKDRIIPTSFGLTEMGRDLLAEDYILKQITASLIYPEDQIGKKFWKRIYQEATKRYGTTNIPVNTFNKVWIVPDKAVVYENIKNGTAYVVESKLKVMLEEDYLSLQRNMSFQNVFVGNLDPRQEHSGVTDISRLGSQILREIIIPQLDHEVNTGKNFAQLRQVYNSLILATWYKKKIKDSILEQIYADKNKVKGVEYNQSVIEKNFVILSKGPHAGHAQVASKDLNKVKDSSVTPQNDVEFIYQQYLRAFKKGVYNYIKEDIDPTTQETIPRKYFSGGVLLQPSNAMRVVENLGKFNDAAQSTESYVVEMQTKPAGTKNAAMNVMEKLSKLLENADLNKDWLAEENEFTRQLNFQGRLNSTKAEILENSAGTKDISVQQQYFRWAVEDFILADDGAVLSEALRVISKGKVQIDDVESIKAGILLPSSEINYMTFKMQGRVSIKIIFTLKGGDSIFCGLLVNLRNKRSAVALNLSDYRNEKLMTELSAYNYNQLWNFISRPFRLQDGAIVRYGYVPSMGAIFSPDVIKGYNSNMYLSASSVGDTVGRARAKFLSRLWKQLTGDLGENDRVLDFAVGEGRDLITMDENGMVKLLDPAIYRKIIPMYFMSSALEIIQQRYPNITTMQADWQNIPKPPVGIHVRRIFGLNAISFVPQSQLNNVIRQLDLVLDPSPEGKKEMIFVVDMQPAHGNFYTDQFKPIQAPTTIEQAHRQHEIFRNQWINALRASLSLQGYNLKVETVREIIQGKAENIHLRYFPSNSFNFGIDTNFEARKDLSIPGGEVKEQLNIWVLKATKKTSKNDAMISLKKILFMLATGIVLGASGLKAQDQAPLPQVGVPEYPAYNETRQALGFEMQPIAVPGRLGEKLLSNYELTQMYRTFHAAWASKPILFVTLMEIPPGASEKEMETIYWSNLISQNFGAAVRTFGVDNIQKMAQALGPETVSDWLLGRTAFDLQYVNPGILIELVQVIGKDAVIDLVQNHAWRLQDMVEQYGFKDVEGFKSFIVDETHKKQIIAQLTGDFKQRILNGDNDNIFIKEFGTNILSEDFTENVLRPIIQNPSAPSFLNNATNMFWAMPNLSEFIQEGDTNKIVLNNLLKVYQLIGLELTSQVKPIQHELYERIQRKILKATNISESVQGGADAGFNYGESFLVGTPKTFGLAVYTHEEGHNLFEESEYRADLNALAVNQSLGLTNARDLYQKLLRYPFPAIVNYAYKMPLNSTDLHTVGRQQIYTLQDAFQRAKMPIDYITLAQAHDQAYKNRGIALLSISFPSIVKEELILYLKDKLNLTPKDLDHLRSVSVNEEASTLSSTDVFQLIFAAQDSHKKNSVELSKAMSAKYKVQKADTLLSVAELHGMSFEKIIASNVKINPKFSQIPIDRPLLSEGIKIVLIPLPVVRVRSIRKFESLRDAVELEEIFTGSDVRLPVPSAYTELRDSFAADENDVYGKGLILFYIGKHFKTEKIHGEEKFVFQYDKKILEELEYVRELLLQFADRPGGEKILRNYRMLIDYLAKPGNSENLDGGGSQEDFKFNEPLEWCRFVMNQESLLLLRLDGLLPIIERNYNSETKKFKAQEIINELVQSGISLPEAIDRLNVFFETSGMDILYFNEGNERASVQGEDVDVAMNSDPKIPALNNNLIERVLVSLFQDTGDVSVDDSGLKIFSHSASIFDAFMRGQMDIEDSTNKLVERYNRGGVYRYPLRKAASINLIAARLAAKHGFVDLRKQLVDYLFGRIDKNEFVANIRIVMPSLEPTDLANVNIMLSEADKWDMGLELKAKSVSEVNQDWLKIAFDGLNAYSGNENEDYMFNLKEFTFDPRTEKILSIVLLTKQLESVPTFVLVLTQGKLKRKNFNGERDLEVIPDKIKEDIAAYARQRGLSFAMTTAPGKAVHHSATGGIDLRLTKNLLQTKFGGNDKIGIKVHLDPAMLQELQNAPGFEADIINIHPLKSLKAFLGVNTLETR